VSVHEVFAGGDVHQVASPLLLGRQAGKTLLAHDPSDQLAIDHQTTVVEEGGTYPASSIGGPGRSMEFGDGVG